MDKKQYPLNQSTFRRAKEDTNDFFHKTKGFILVECVVMGGFGYLATIFTPDDASKYIQALYPFIGAVVGALVGLLLIYLFFLIIAPYKQRNEARALLKHKEPTHLNNRAELITSLVNLQNSLIDFIVNPEIFGDMEYTSNIYKSILVSEREFQKEKFVAGSHFQVILDEFESVIMEYFIKSFTVMVKDGETVTIPIEIQNDFAESITASLEKTVRDINEISGE